MLYVIILSTQVTIKFYCGICSHNNSYNYLKLLHLFFSLVFYLQCSLQFSISNLHHHFYIYFLSFHICFLQHNTSLVKCVYEIFKVNSKKLII